MRETFSEINKKNVIVIILFFLIFSGIVFAYQKNNNAATVKKENSPASKSAIAESYAMDEKKKSDSPSLNVLAAGDGGSISEDNETKKQEKNNSKIKEWILNLMGFQEREAEVLNVPEEYKTIQSAINNARKGDIIKVAEGEYKENIMIKNGVSLEGEVAEKTVLDGNSLGNVITFKNVRDSRTYLSGFTIKNAGKSLSGISIENSSPWIHDNVIVENEFGIYVKGESRPVIQKNTIKNSSKGIQAYNFAEKKTDEDAAAIEKDEEARTENDSVLNLAQNEKDIVAEESKTKPIIMDNLIIDNKIGIDLYNSYANIEHNNISYNNHYKTHLGATCGINISGSSSDISSNIITDNGICELCAGIIADEGSKGVLIGYNDIWNNKNDFLCFGECVLEDNNISEDPLYADTMAGDYKLQAESALIGKAKDGLDIGIRW